MRSHEWRARLAALALLPLLAAPACGRRLASEQPPSTIEATVKGRVTFEGKAITEGKVVFVPVGAGATPREAAIGKDGTYAAKTLTGTNTVKLEGVAAIKSPKLRDFLSACEVKEGENSFDVEIK